jgi:uncharacterized protein (TIGR03067 family)
MLWVVVLLKLVTPPIVTVPIHWTAETQPSSRNLTPLESMPPEELMTLEDEPDALVEDGAGGDLAADAASSVAANEASQRASLLDAAMMRIRSVPWKSWLLPMWLSGSIICLIIVAYRIVGFQRLLRNATPAEEPVMAQAHQLGCLLGLRRSPLIVMLPGRISPVVWQLAGSVTIVLPQDLFGRLDHDSQQTVLTHELAHIGRKDHWVRLLEVVATLLFWWNPVLWWTRRRLHELEEQCCDAEVLRVLPNSARSYANALVDTVEFLRGAHTVAPAMATGVRPTFLLKRRIEMVVRGNSIASLSLLHLTAVALVGLAVLPLAMVLQADELPERYKTLQGTWRLVSSQHDGVLDPDVVGCRVRFDGNTVTTIQKDGTRRETRFTLPFKRGDCRINAVENGRAVVGIYEIVGDTLRICTRIGGPTSRPASFRADKGEETILNVLKRVADEPR